MKPFLILQLRPEDIAANSEFAAILDKAGLKKNEVLRIRLDKDHNISQLNLDNFSAIIVGGGPGCVSDPIETKPPLEKKIEDSIMELMKPICEKDIPFLGCCYGIGILAHFLGGVVNKEKYSEPVGATECTLTKNGEKDELLAGMAKNFRAFVGHKEAVQELPANCTNLVTSKTCPFQMIKYKSNIYATQFHPEADNKEFELRIKIYKNYGYFAPDEAEKLIKMVRGENVTIPEKLLANFVKKYKVSG